MGRQLAASGLLKGDWDETQHPRAGCPPNAGRFAPKPHEGSRPGSSLSGPSLSSAPRDFSRLAARLARSALKVAADLSADAGEVRCASRSERLERSRRSRRIRFQAALGRLRIAPAKAVAALEALTQNAGPGMQISARMALQRQRAGDGSLDQRQSACRAAVQPSRRVQRGKPIRFALPITTSRRSFRGAPCAARRGPRCTNRRSTARTISPPCTR